MKELFLYLSIYLSVFSGILFIIRSFVRSFVQDFSNVVTSPQSYDIIPFPRLSAKSILQIEGILKQFEFKCNDYQNNLL